MNPSQVLRTTAAVVALALLTPLQAHASGRPDPAGTGADPSLRAHVLARAGHGRAVVAALGDKLPAAAATNRMSPTKLRAILERDPSAWIGEDGQMFFVEEAEAFTAAPDEVAAPSTATYPESQTFALHSLPSSTHTIFLDFDGATVSNTWWNSASAYNPSPMPARFYAGFTLDSDPSTFTSAEKAYIQQVWRIVAEKYAPFDVDVTTQDPGPGGYNRNGLLDATYGDHVIITNDAVAAKSACDGSCSGIALLGTFDDSGDTDGYLEPAWVFSSTTWGSAVLTAHTAAHEVGHTFGLQHDGTTSPVEAYNTGHGNWFPIMGSGIRGVGQWSKGEYASANNDEDDLAIIAAAGAPLRPDDHSDVSPDALASGGVAEGVIEDSADTDTFAVDHDCTTNLTARVTGVEAGATLDASITVLNGSGKRVGSANPASWQTSSWPALPTGMDAQVTVPAAAGTYYLKVDGVGNGDPLYTGYSDYGSVGQYVVAVSACDGTMPPVTLPAAPAPGSTNTVIDTTGTTGTTSTRAAVPGAPGIGRAKSGRRGGKITATARWYAPAGASAVTGYRIRAEKLASSGRVVRAFTTRMLSSGSRSATLRLAKGKYRFMVQACNRAGASRWSAPSRTVLAR